MQKKILKPTASRALAALISMAAAFFLTACEIRPPVADKSQSAEVAGAPLRVAAELGYQLTYVNEAWEGPSADKLSSRMEYTLLLPDTLGPLTASFTVISTRTDGADALAAFESPDAALISQLQSTYESIGRIERRGETVLDFFGEQISARTYQGVGIQATRLAVPVDLVIASRQSRQDIVTLIAIYPSSAAAQLDAIKTLAQSIQHPLNLRQEALETRSLALSGEDPQIAERIIHHYVPSKATMVARSHAVGNYQGCVATWIGPNTALTAAHCGNRNQISMEIYPDGDFGQKWTLSYSCNAERATAFWASNADLRILECDSGQGPAPGDIHGWVDYSILGLEQAGDPVYSVWTNPIDGIDGADSSTRLYSEGEVIATDSQTWANANCERAEHWLALYSPKKEPPFGHRTSVYGEKGASGSLQFSPTTHTAVIGPTSTATADGSRRRAASIGHMLEVDGHIAPGEFYWLETNVDTSLQRPQSENQNPGNSDRNETTGCILESSEWLLQNVARANASGTRAFDVHQEIDHEITQRPIYNLDFNSEWRRLLWTGRAAFNGFARNLGYSSEEPWQTHARLSSVQANGAPALSHSRLNLGLNAVYDVRVEYAWSEGIANLPDLEIAIDGCASEIVSTNTIGTSSQIRGYHWVHAVLDASNCSGSSAEFSINLASAGSIDLRRVVLAKEGAVWDFETWDTREPWTESRANHRYEKHALVYGTQGNERRFSAFIDPSENIPRGLALPGAPIRGGECYEMTFDARAVDSSTATAVLTVAGGAGLETIIEKSFTPGLSWSAHAVLFRTGDDQANAVPRFELGSSGSGRVTIDDVRFTPDPQKDLRVWVGGRNPRHVEITLGPGGLQAAETPLAASASLPNCDDPDSDRLDLSAMEWVTDAGQTLFDSAGQALTGQNVVVPGSYLSDGSGGFQDRAVSVQYGVEGQHVLASVLLRPCVRRDNFQTPVPPILADYPACPRHIVIGSIIDELMSAFGTASPKDLLGPILTFPDFPDLVRDDYPGCQPTWCPIPFPALLDVRQALQQVLDSGRYGRLAVTFLGQMVQALDQSQDHGSAVAALEAIMTAAGRARLQAAESEMLLAAYSTAQAGLLASQPGESLDRALWTRALDESEQEAFLGRGFAIQPASDALAGFISAVALDAYSPRADDIDTWLKYSVFGAAVGVASAYRDLRNERVR